MICNAKYPKGSGTYTAEGRKQTELLAYATLHNAITHGNRPTAVVTTQLIVALERSPIDALALAEMLELGARELRAWAAKNTEVTGDSR